MSEEAEEELAGAKNAIQRIQAAIRGSQLRTEMAQARFLRLLQTSAAEKLQAIFRGNKTRATDMSELQKQAFARREVRALAAGPI